MRKFIIRKDVIKSVQKALEGNKDILHDFDTGLCTLSPYMPSHLDLGNEDCCGIFNAINDKNIVICNECEMSINDAIRQVGQMEDCPVCHGQGATTDHHDPRTECGGSGKVGG